MALRDLLVSFGIDVTGRDKLDQVDASLSNLIDKSQLLVKTLLGLQVVKMTTGFITDVVDMGAKVTDTANRLGVGTDELQEFDYMAKMVGVSSETAARSLSFLERNIGLAAIGSKAVSKSFAGLGVNIKDSNGKTKDLNEILPEVADRIQALGDQNLQAAYAQKLFGRAGAAMVPILRGGSKAVQEMHKQFEELGGGLHKDFLAAAKEADRGLSRLGITFDMMKSRIVLGILPALEVLVKGLMKVTNFFGDMADHTYGAQTALIALGAIALAVFGPMLVAIAPIVATVGTLYLAFDDLFTLFRGGDSLTGRFIDSLFGEGAHVTFVQDIKDDIQAFKNWSENDFFPWLKTWGPQVVKWMGVAIPEGLRDLGRFLDAMWQTLKGITNSLDELVHGNWSGAGRAVDLANSKIAIALTGRDSEAWENANAKMEQWLKTASPEAVLQDPNARNYLQHHAETHPEQDRNYSTGVDTVNKTITLPTIEVTTNVHFHGSVSDTRAAAQHITDAQNSNMAEAGRKALAQLRARMGNPQPEAAP